MSLTLFDPWRSRDPFDRIVDSFFGAPAVGSESPVVDRAWRPATDVEADTNGYTFRMDVPGVSKDDLDINVEDGVLRISGERKSDREEGEAERGFYRRETLRGRFERSFRLPKDADASEVTATYADGVLTVHVAKLETAQPRRIPIATVPEASA